MTELNIMLADPHVDEDNGLDRGALYGDPFFTRVYFTVLAGNPQMSHLYTTTDGATWSHLLTLPRQAWGWALTTVPAGRVYVFDCPSQTPTLIAYDANTGASRTHTLAGSCQALQYVGGGLDVSQTITRLTSPNGFTDQVRLAYPSIVNGHQEMRVQNVQIAWRGTAAAFTDLSPIHSIAPQVTGGTILQADFIQTDRADFPSATVTDAALLYWYETAQTPAIGANGYMAVDGNFGTVSIWGAVVVGSTWTQPFQISNGTWAPFGSPGDYHMGSFHFDSASQRLRFVPIWVQADGAGVTAVRQNIVSVPLAATALRPAAGRAFGYKRSDGVDAVVYRGTDAHIYELTFSSDHWIASDLSIVTGAADALGDPAAYLRSDGSPRINAVVYRASDNHVHELKLESGAWAQGDLMIGDAISASGDPFGYARADNVNSVVFRGSDGKVHELYLQSGVWGDGIPLGSATAAAGDPFGYVHSGTSSIVYRATDNHIREIYRSTGAWAAFDLSGTVGAPNASGDPVAYVRTGGIPSIVYRAANDHIQEVYYQGGWLTGDLTNQSGSPNAQGDPAAFVRSDNVNSVLYRSVTDNHLREIRLPSGGGSWQAGDISTAGTGGPNAAGDPWGYVRADNGIVAVYRSSDNHVIQMRLINGAWTFTDS